MKLCKPTNVFTPKKFARNMRNYYYNQATRIKNAWSNFKNKKKKLIYDTFVDKPCGPFLISGRNFAKSIFPKQYKRLYK